MAQRLSTKWARACSNMSCAWPAASGSLKPKSTNTASFSSGLNRQFLCNRSSLCFSLWIYPERLCRSTCR